MREQFVAGFKSVLRPIVRHRFLIERAKYRGTRILSPQEGNDEIGRLLASGEPGALGKMGASELGGLRHYERCKDANGNCTRWGMHHTRLNTNAGVYPADPVIFARFCREFAKSLGSLNLMAVWFQFGEYRLRTKFSPSATLVRLTAMEPYYHERPWSAHLAGKKVLVISPFSSTIAKQYANRAEVWKKRPEVMPDFELDTLRCPLSAGLVEPQFSDWFVALDAMQAEMDRRAYDVVIVGAGAWSLPLVAHAKSRGKWGIHLGGPTQILFGVLGGRWDAYPKLQALYNDAWTRPQGEDRPTTFRKVENGCYW